MNCYKLLLQLLFQGLATLVLFGLVAAITVLILPLEAGSAVTTAETAASGHNQTVPAEGLLLPQLQITPAYTIYLPIILGGPEVTTPPSPTDCTPDPPGESDNIDDALEICSDQVVTGEVVNSSDPDDVYKIYAQTGQQIDIALTGSGLGNVAVGLYEPDATDIYINTPVKNSPGLFNDEQINHTATVDGYWYVDVRCHYGFIIYTFTTTISGTVD